MRKFLYLVFFMMIAGSSALAQTLSVSQGEFNPLSASELAGAQKVVLMQLKLTAGQSSFIVTSMSFQGTGTIDEQTDITALYIYEDINENGLLDIAEQQVASPASFSADNGAAVFSGFYLSAPVSYSVNILVIADFAGTATNGENVVISIQDSSGITAVQYGTNTPAVLDATFPVMSNTRTIADVGTLSVMKNKKSPGDQAVLNNADDIVMLELTLTASSCEPVRIESFTVSSDGTADESVAVLASGVRLYYDTDYDGALGANDQAVSPYGIGFESDNADAMFWGPFTDIPAGASVYIMVVYELSGFGLDSETLNARIASSTSIVAKGTTTGQYVQISGPPVSGNPVTISPPPPPPAEEVEPDITEHLCFAGKAAGSKGIKAVICIFFLSGILAVIAWCCKKGS